jgi:hypothetical protein
MTTPKSSPSRQAKPPEWCRCRSGGADSGVSAGAFRQGSWREVLKDRSAAKRGCSDRRWAEDSTALGWSSAVAMLLPSVHEGELPRIVELEAGDALFVAPFFRRVGHRMATQLRPIRNPPATVRSPRGRVHQGLSELPLPHKDLDHAHEKATQSSRPVARSHQSGESAAGAC